MTLPDGQPHLTTKTTKTAETAETAETAVSLGDGDLHVCEDGRRDAPALLLIHGTAFSGRSWDLLVPLLTRSHRVVRIDLLGCGRSAKPEDASYELPDQARRVGEVLDRLGIDRATVVGHSSGGMVATALAERRPGLVTALVVVNTGPSMDAFIAPASAELGPEQWPPSDEQIRQLASTGFGRSGRQVTEEVVAELRSTSFQVFAALMQTPRDYVMERTLPDRLKVLGKPLLVIFGEDDRRWRSSSAADYRIVPGAKVELLSGLGHTPILEDPARTAEVMLAFSAPLAERES
ncbi:alpha/beta hydrolase [Actinopolymorpha sp. NPDC004070]|uniref:alpha/beta fold hydrolase n=1 Tax=Actinopolymorpha sp. NPDC004070 TaxID=3154548 RepID=UPI0033BCE8DB